MKLERSPDLNEYKEGIPEPPPDPQIQRKRFRILLLILLLFVLVLGGINFLRTPTAALLAGQGTVQGSVINEDGEPFQDGYIFILGTDLETQTGTNGDFILENVPAGEQSLIVADDFSGWEFPVRISAGETTNVGQIQFVPTTTP